MNFLEPVYFRNNNTNDYNNPLVKNPRLEQFQRIVCVALPFIPLPESAKLGLHSFTDISRTIESLITLKDAWNKNDNELIKYALLQTVISTAITASTIFAAPLGSLLTTGQTLVAHSKELVKALNDGDRNKSLLLLAEILNNSLYLSLFFTGASQIVIASLSLQILLGLANATQDIKNEKYIEAFGNLLGVLIRGNQLKIEVGIYQLQKAIDHHVAEVEKNATQIALDIEQASDNNIYKSTKDKKKGKESKKPAPAKKPDELYIKIASNEKDLIKKTDAFFKNPEVMKKQMPECDLSKLIGGSPKDTDVIDALLKTHQGFHVGERHDHEAARAFIMNNMDYLKGKNVKALFAEGWNYETQSTIDKYFAVQHLRELNSSDLKKVKDLLFFSEFRLKKKPNSPYTCLALLEKTKKAGIRLVGIDYEVLKDEPISVRLKKMNFVATKVMEACLKTFKTGEKFVGFMGAAHLRDWSEIVRVKGLADLTETPAIWIMDKPPLLSKGPSLVYTKLDESPMSLPINVFLKEAIC